MRTLVSITVVAVTVLASPVMPASILGQSTDSSAAINHIASLSADIITKINSYNPVDSVKNFALTNKLAYQNICWLLMRNFAHHFAAMVSSYRSLHRIKRAFIILKKNIAPHNENFAMPVQLLIQAVGRQNLATNPRLVASFIAFLSAMEAKDDKPFSLHITARDYYFLLYLTKDTPGHFKTMIGDDFSRHIENTFSSSGLGITQSWSADQILWFFEEYLPTLSPQDPPIPFYQDDITAACCAIIDAVQRDANHQPSAPLTPTIVHTILTRMETVRWTIAHSLCPMKPVPPAVYFVPLESPPPPYEGTGLPTCLKTLPSISAILAGFWRALDSAPSNKLRQRARLFLNDQSSTWSIYQIKWFGFNPESIWRLAFVNLIVAPYTIKHIYALVLRLVYGIDENSKIKPKATEVYKQNAGGGYLGWQMQRHIVYELVREKRYRRAADIFEFLNNNELLPKELSARSDDVLQTILSGRLAKSGKLASLGRALF